MKLTAVWEGTADLVAYMDYSIEPIYMNDPVSKDGQTAASTSQSLYNQLLTALGQTSASSYTIKFGSVTNSTGGSMNFSTSVNYTLASSGNYAFANLMFTPNMSNTARLTL